MPDSSTSSDSIPHAGFTLTKSSEHNPNPVPHGEMGQAERAFSVASTFLSGVMAISASQFLGAPLKLIDPKIYQNYMAWTKESFAILMTTITQWWSPTIVRVSGDESMVGQLYQMKDGSLKCNFPHRLVLMANHQLYTDWLYLWWIAYTNNMHGRIYIIMKESLKNLPIFGWGAQFYNFIFLSRKWEKDQFRLRRAFDHLRSPRDPMWLIIFPEGTNLSASTRLKSAAWAKKSGLADMKNLLLPRTTGLQFSLEELKESTNWLYDATIAYEGIPSGMYGQDIFTLRSSLFEGRPPKSVNIYWRRYKISDIPVDNEQAFARWLNNRWREKDYLLEYFYRFNRFPSGTALEALHAVQGKGRPRHANIISTEVKAGGWDEFLSIFRPLISTASVISAVDPTDTSNLNLEALLHEVMQQQQSQLLKDRKSPIAANGQETIEKALQLGSNVEGHFSTSALYDLAKRLSISQQGPEQRFLTVPKASGKTSKREASRRRPVLTKQAHSDPVQATAGAIKDSIKTANLEAVITRPLTTIATQSAVGAITDKAAQPIQTKIVTLPRHSSNSPAVKNPIGCLVDVQSTNKPTCRPGRATCKNAQPDGPLTRQQSLQRSAKTAPNRCTTSLTETKAIYRPKSKRNQINAAKR